ncbi:MAG TPA: M12 family metallo-peptidase, partial [Actinomycetota bacterium]|nr:M12 family metallo-peptidase [Actinomycetota bacterium]
TYRGITVGGLDVRLVLDGSVWGLVRVRSTGDGWILRARNDGGADAVPLSSVVRRPVGADDDGPVPDRHLQADPAEGPLLLRLAVEVDHALWVQRPGTWRETAEQLLWLTDAAFEQIDVHIRIDHLDAWTVPDPYTAPQACSASDGSPGKLQQLRDRWSDDHRPRDAVHLMAGAVSGPVGGCAYTAALNDPRRAYGVSRIDLSRQGADPAYVADNVNLLAHEIGHNVGGRHARSIGAYGVTGAGATGVVPPYTLMNPYAQNGLWRFSDLEGVVSPATNEQLDNARPMRSYAASRLGAAG